MFAEYQNVTIYGLMKLSGYKQLFYVLSRKQALEEFDSFHISSSRAGEYEGSERTLNIYDAIDAIIIYPIIVIFIVLALCLNFHSPICLG